MRIHFAKESNRMMNRYWGLNYAPHKCKQFCCGDCVIDMRTCTITYDECTKPEKKLKPEILNKINEVNE